MKHLIVILASLTVCRAQSSFNYDAFVNPPSPQILGMGGAGVASFSHDPFLPFLNPAHAGNGAAGGFISLGFHDRPELAFDRNNRFTGASAFVASAAYRFDGWFEAFPIDVGLAYRSMSSELEWREEPGHETAWLEEHHSFAFSFGSEWKQIRLHAGMGFHSSGYTYRSDSEIRRDETGIGSYDYGFLLSVPLLAWIERDTFTPFAHASIGYSAQFLSSDVAHALERTATMGIAMKAGLNARSGSYEIELASFEYEQDARALLLRYLVGTGVTYRTPSGEMKVWENVVRGKADNTVSIHKGWRFTVLELVGFATGSLRNTYFWRMEPTYAFSLHLSGAFKLAASHTDSALLRYLSEHVGLSFHRASSGSMRRAFLIGVTGSFSAHIR